MVKALRTSATDKEILEWNLEEMEREMYDLTCVPMYEESDRFETLRQAIRDTKEKIKKSVLIP